MKVQKIESKDLPKGFSSLVSLYDQVNELYKVEYSDDGWIFAELTNGSAPVLLFACLTLHTLLVWGFNLGFWMSFALLLPSLFVVGAAVAMILMTNVSGSAMTLARRMRLLICSALLISMPYVLFWSYDWVYMFSGAGLFLLSFMSVYVVDYEVDHKKFYIELQETTPRGPRRIRSARNYLADRLKGVQAWRFDWLKSGLKAVYDQLSGVDGRVKAYITAPYKWLSKIDLTVYAKRLEDSLRVILPDTAVREVYAIDVRNDSRISALTGITVVGQEWNREVPCIELLLNRVAIRNPKLAGEFLEEIHEVREWFLNMAFQIARDIERTGVTSNGTLAYAVTWDPVIHQLHKKYAQIAAAEAFIAKRPEVTDLEEVHRLIKLENGDVSENPVEPPPASDGDSSTTFVLDVS